MNHRRRDIQGLRAVSVVLVVLFHSKLPIPGGYIGVDVFFVISGFVITGMLQRQFQLKGRIGFAHFYLKRSQRLIPALAMMLVFILGLSIFLQSPLGAQRITGLTALGAMFFGANFAIPLLSGGYFAPSAETNPLLNTWSLSVEEQFYLIFPALLLAGWLLQRRLRRFRYAPILIVLGLTTVSFVLMLVTMRMGSFHGQILFGFFGPVSRAWEFGVGALIALYLVRQRSIPGLITNTASVLGLLLLLAGALAFTPNASYPGLLTLVPVIGAALLLFGGSQGNGPITKLLSSRPLVRIGDISYSWYLWHWPLIVFALILWPETPFVAGIAALISLIPALISFHWVEQPIRSMTFSGRKSILTLFTATYLPVLVISAVLLIGASRQWGVEWNSGGDPTRSAAADRGCHDTQFDPALCSWPITDPAGSVLLVGDSQAHALSDGVIEAASSLGYSTVVSSQNACPFAAPGRILWNPRYAAEKEYCAMWQQEVLDYALDSRPDVVVIANRSPLYVNAEMDYATLLSSDGTPAQDLNQSAREWQDMIQSTVSKLTEAGIRVVLVAEPPEGASADIAARQSLLIRNPSIPPRASRNDAEALRSASFAAEKSAVQSTAGTILVDPFTALCNIDNCPGDKGGQPLYSDGTHLSRIGSLALSTLIGEAIKSVTAR